MTTSEKESRLSAASGELPSWQEIMELFKSSMNDKLANAESDNDRRRIEGEYEHTLDEMLKIIDVCKKRDSKA